MTSWEDMDRIKNGGTEADRVEGGRRRMRRWRQDV